MKQINVLYLFVVLSCTSCVTSKHLTYFQDIFSNKKSGEQAVFVQFAEPTIQVDDQLLITVNALEPSGAAPFNLQYVFTPQVTALPDRPTMQYYQVNTKGEIDFPLLGTLKVAGLKKSELHALLLSHLEKLLKDPVVNIRFVNFHVTVLGAVAKPGVYTPQGDRITILDALAMAGDITRNAKADEVLIIRENNGKVETICVNLLSSALFTSPCYYLQQNDVIYVAPCGAQLNK